MKPEYCEYKIEKLEVSDAKLKILNEALNKKYASSTFKLNRIKSTFGTVCGFCRSEQFDFPARKVIYKLEDCERVETYCLKCFEKAGHADSNKPKPKPKKRSKK